MSRLTPLLLLFACAETSIGLGKGAEPDARLAADLFTWPCEQDEYDEYGVFLGTLNWEGVFDYSVSLEYAPDGLVDRSLPAEGCVAGSDIFASDAGSAAMDIPDVTSPGWTTGDLTGTLDRKTEGFYYASDPDSERGCSNAEELLGDGTILSDAGAFSGVQTPAPGTYEGVTLSGDVDSQTGLEFGATVTAEWEASGWSNAWVQVRRENGGSLVESVTCSATGSTSYTIDDAVWSLMTAGIETDVTNLYVAVENEGFIKTEDGQVIRTITRAMHVAVVQD